MKFTDFIFNQCPFVPTTLYVSKKLCILFLCTFEIQLSTTTISRIYSYMLLVIKNYNDNTSPWNFDTTQ